MSSKVWQKELLAFVVLHLDVSVIGVRLLM
jgi:hypothetical protein